MEERIFLPRRNVGLQAALYLAGGGVVICIGLIGLLADFAAPAGHDQLPGVFGGMMVLPIFSIAYGVFLLCAPVRVVIDPEKISIDGRISRQQIFWTQVAQISREKSRAMFGRADDVMILLDKNEKPLAKIRDVFANFPALVSEIESRAAFDRQADLTRKIATQIRRGKFMMVFCAFFALLGLAIAIAGVAMVVHQHRFAREQVVTDAKILQLHFKSVTPYVQYSFNDEYGRPFTRDAMIDQPTYDQLLGQTTVPVRYMHSDPDWNYLVQGEADDFSGWFFVGGGMALLVLFGGFVLLRMMGYADITIKDGKFHMKKIGEMDDALEAPPRAPLQAVLAVDGPVMAAPMAAKTPSGITTIAILNIVLGGIGALFNVGRIIFVMVMQGKTLDIGDRSILIDPPAWLTAWYAVNLLAALLLVISAFGLLSLKPWGRRLAILAAIVQILSTTATIAQHVIEVATQPETQDIHTRSAVLTGEVGGIIFQLLTAVYPLIVLIVLSRRTTAATFAKKV